MSIRLRLPEMSEPLYCPPSPVCPPSAGNRSLAVFGARPESLTIIEEFSNPVPFPLATISRDPTAAIADGYWPAGMKPASLDRSRLARARATTATALL